MAAETTLVRCSVIVEVAGRPLNPDKSVGKKGGPELGLQVVRPARGTPALRVLGFKREIRLFASDIRQIVASRVAEGRLALVARDGMKVVVSKAQPAQLEMVLQCVQEREQGLGQSQTSETSAMKAVSKGGRGCSSHLQPVAGGDNVAGCPRMVATPSKVPRETSSTLQPAAEESAASSFSRVSMCVLRQVEFELLLSFEQSVVARARLSETCSYLSSFIIERQKSFQLGRTSRAAGIPVELVANRVAKHAALTDLDLSGYLQLTPGAANLLSEVLGCLNGGLLRLSLRGCKSMTDASIRRLLSSCPRLEVLNLLEIPRLSNRALDADLSNLRILAVGTLVRSGASARSTALANDVGINSAARTRGTIAVLGSVPTAPQQRQQGSAQFTSQFTSALLTRLARPQAPGVESNLGGAPLTHVVLANCSEVEVLPRLPKMIQHLDLRGANLQVPDAAVAGWRPLMSCTQLATLCLAGNMLLSSDALQACINSLPDSARLVVLDLSGTRADDQVFHVLPQAHQALTHLRLSGCMGLRNAALFGLLVGLPDLEVFDVAGCSNLEHPLADLSLPVTVERGVTRPSQAEKLRLLGIGQTEFAMHMDSTRRALVAIAPVAQAVNGSLDIFGSYADLPPTLLRGPNPLPLAGSVSSSAQTSVQRIFPRARGAA